MLTAGHQLGDGNTRSLVASIARNRCVVWQDVTRFRNGRTTKVGSVSYSFIRGSLVNLCLKHTAPLESKRLDEYESTVEQGQNGMQYEVLLYRHKTGSFLTIHLDLDDILQVRGAVAKDYIGWKVVSYEQKPLGGTPGQGTSDGGTKPPL